MQSVAVEQCDRSATRQPTCLQPTSASHPLSPGRPDRPVLGVLMRPRLENQRARSLPTCQRSRSTPSYQVARRYYGSPRVSFPKFYQANIGSTWMPYYNLRQGAYVFLAVCVQNVSVSSEGILMILSRQCLYAMDSVCFWRGLGFFRGS